MLPLTISPPVYQQVDHCYDCYDIYEAERFGQYRFSTLLFVEIAIVHLKYQRIINGDWERVQAFSQNGITWLVNTLTHISSNIDTSHSGTLSNIGIPLASSVSAGFASHVQAAYAARNEELVPSYRNIQRGHYGDSNFRKC